MFCLGFILRRADTKLGRLFLRPFDFLRWISTAMYFAEKMEAVWTIASKYRYYSVTNPQKGVFPLLLCLLVQKKKKNVVPFFSSFFYIYIYIFVKFLNLAVLAGQYCSCNAKNSPFQAFRWWGASSIFPSRPTIWTPGTGYAKNGSLFSCDVTEGDRFYSSNISFASSSGAWFSPRGERETRVTRRWLVTNRKGPWEGERREAPVFSYPPSFARRFYRER